MAMALLGPAFAHGSQLGPYDVANTWGLGALRNVVVSNFIASDQIRQMAPWAVLNWNEVHAGHLPLWNPYSGLGLPQLFDFQSGGLSLPMLVAYAFPVRFAYDVVVIGRFMICGTGILFLSRRVLRLGWVPAVFAGSIAELSGAFSGWSGWPMSGVLAWFGWILGAAVLVIRGPARFRWGILLGVSVMFSIYGGHPESMLILALAVTVAVVVILVAEARARGVRPVAVATGWVAGAVAGGVALAAPLWLPGSMLLHNDVELNRPNYAGVPLLGSVNLAFSGFYGFPLTSSTYFGPVNYYEMSAFVGVIALMLVALAVAIRWRDPMIAGLVVAAVVLFAVAYLPPVAHLLDHIPALRVVYWNRTLIPLDLVLGVLAGVGLQELASASRTSAVVRRFTAIAVAGGVAMTVVVVRQARVKIADPATLIRDHSVEWSAIECFVALLGAIALMYDHRRQGRSSGERKRDRGVLKKVVLATLVAAELVFLLAATPNLWSSSSSGFTPTVEVKTLQKDASGQRVGLGECESLTAFISLGIYAETNIAYGVAEFAIYDPILPNTYLTAYEALTSRQADYVPGNLCPAITTAAVARNYGVSLVLEPRGHKGPKGTVAGGTIGDEGLFKVPGSGIVTIEPVGETANAADAGVLRTSSPSPEEVQFVTDAKASSTVYIHIGNFQGWSATIDGRPLPLRTWVQVEMAAEVPAGRHTIVLHYDPGSFRLGIYIALVVVIGVVAAVGLVVFRRRRVSPVVRTTSS
jgi:hypothetical protein